MAKKNKAFGAKAVRKAIRKNPVTTGLGASLAALFAAAAGSPWVRARARRLGESVRGKLARRREESSLVITDPNRTPAHG